MVVVGILGIMGDGKTLTLTHQAKKLHEQGRNIAANYNLKIPHEKILTPTDLNKIYDTSILMDEGWMWFHSHHFQGSLEEALVAVVIESRRRKNDIFWTAQRAMQMHKWVREVTSFYLVPEMVGDPHDPDSLVRVMKVDPMAYNMNDSAEEVDRFRAGSVWDYYDHREEMGYMREALQQAKIEHMKKREREKLLKKRIKKEVKEEFEKEEGLGRV